MDRRNDQLEFLCARRALRIFRRACAACLVLAALAPGAWAAGTFEWAVGSEGPSGGTGHAIAVDGAGNVYTTGEFFGSVSFGSFPLTSAGGLDIFVAKQTPDGSFEWATAMGGPALGGDEGLGIAVDGAGNVYTTGYFVGTADFGPFQLTSASGPDLFVVKQAPNGNFLWARSMGGAVPVVGNGIAVDAAGNVYTTGRFADTADFDPGPGTFNLTSTGVRDVFVSKLDTNGDFVWARAMGGTGSDEGHGIAVDSTGDVYVTGEFQDVADFDPGPDEFNLTSAGSADIFVSKLDTNGNFVWARALGGTGTNEGHGIAVDSTGNVYTTGIFRETVDFDPGPDTFNLVATSFTDIFVSKLDANGDFVWAQSMGSTGFDLGHGIAFGGAGDAYITGSFQNTADFGPFQLTSAGSNDMFVSKLDAAGNFVWAHSMGGTGNDRGFGIAVNAAGDVHVTGSFQDTVDFDPGPDTFNITATGSRGVFVVKLLDPDIIPPNAIAITPGATGPTNAASVAFTVEFDEPVQNFEDAADLVIAHSGTAHTGVDVDGGPEIFTVTVEGISGDGSFTLAVSTASNVEDLAGNSLDSSVTSDPVVIDNTPPVFSGLDVSPSEAAVGDEVVIAFASSEPIAGAPDVLVNGNPASASLKSPFAFSYTVSALEPLGPATIQISGADAAGNAALLEDNVSLVIVEAASGLPAAVPAFAALALLGTALALLHKRPRRRAT